MHVGILYVHCHVISDDDHDDGMGQVAMSCWLGTRYKWSLFLADRGTQLERVGTHGCN